MDEFNSEDLIMLVNNSMNFAHPLIHSLKIYFLRNLCQRDFSIDDIRRFCEAQKKSLPWLGTLNWEDIRENRLSINPYCSLPEYNEAERSFSTYYSISNKAPFQLFMQNIKQKDTLTARLSLMGLFFVRLHALRASREWQHAEIQSADFLTKELTGMNKLPVLFKTISTKILSNKFPLLQIANTKISNDDLFLKSVIAHIIAFHASIDSNSSQLAMYLHNLQNCQNFFIIACISDSESLVLNAVAASEGVTRYACQCGMKYVIANCGGAVTTGVCPNCKNTIGGVSYKPAAGNTRIDTQPTAQIATNDQAGYIGEPINPSLTYCVRSLPPTSYRILHLIVHALFGASAPQPALTFLRKNNQTVSDAERYCMDHIQNDWKVLKQLLNCNHERLALMFHSLISSMTEKPPSNQPINTPVDRDNWEVAFHRDYIAPKIKNITETEADYRTKLNAALAKSQKINIIEGEINQTLAMDKQYRIENLPSLWRMIGVNNFDSFRAYYMSDVAKNKKNYPFLSVFFKYVGQLDLLRHLFPIVKFVQLLHSKLGYHLSRQKARDLTFRQFIEQESNYGENREMFNSLKTAFNDFKLGWDTVICYVRRYQCHELPKDKPIMNYELPVVFGLMEPKDTGIFLCAILDYLVNLQNNFLQEVVAIPPGTCRSLKFLDEPTFDVELTSASTSAQPNTPNGYYLQSMRIDHVRSVNIVNFEWDDEILAYCQRNLAIAKGQDIVYDLTKIEVELANILVFEKVHIETQPESQLYLEPFPYHMELFHGCMRILSDIKHLVPQEPIPIEKLSLLGASSSLMYPQQESTLDNASEVLSSLEILLCFVKRTAVGDKEKSIKDYVLQWMRLSSLVENAGFTKFLNLDLRLKHLVSLYEYVEEQVANVKIKYIHEKYKVLLSVEMENNICESVEFEQQTTVKDLIPAEAFALALKRFMLRFLTVETQKEMEPLYIYLQDISLNFWPSTIPEKCIDELFPENLMVANTFAAYEFTMNKIEVIEQNMRRQANLSRNYPVINQRTAPATRNVSTRKGKKGTSKFDAM